VESIASKNPKELTGLIEQISGSDELKRDYEQFEEEKATAEEKSALVYQKKKTMVMERKQKKEQKEEAEKHLRLQDQLVTVSLFDLCSFVCIVYLIGTLLMIHPLFMWRRGNKRRKILWYPESKINSKFKFILK
jgi:hypothetical protein